MGDPVTVQQQVDEDQEALNGKKITPKVQAQNVVLEKTLQDYKNSIYDFAAYPSNYALDDKQGFKIWSDHVEFIAVLKRVEKMLNKKNEVFKVKGRILKTVKQKGPKNPMQVSIFMENTGMETGNLHVSFTQPKQFGHMLTITRAKGAEFSYHAQYMFDSISHIIDVFLMPDKKFSEKDFIITEETKKNTVCDKCGVDWRTPRGLDLHQQAGCNSQSKRSLDTSSTTASGPPAAPCPAARRGGGRSSCCRPGSPPPRSPPRPARPSPRLCRTTVRSYRSSV